MNLLYSHIDAAVEALKADAALNAEAIRIFGAPLLICRGTFFGNDKILGRDHAPFVCISPAEDEADVGPAIVAGETPVPRTVSLLVLTGVPMDDRPIPVPPLAVERQASDDSVLFVSGNGTAGEAFHYLVLRTVTEIWSARGFAPTDISTYYSGSMRFPLETFESTVALSAPATVTGGAF